MQKYLLLLLAILLPIILIIYYYSYYEIDSQLSVQCTFHQLTGLQCPGCGGQRAFHFLLHGKLLTALHYNILIVLAVPLLSCLYYSIVQAYILKNKKYINHPFWGTKFVLIMLTILVLFFIVRNIPIYPFTLLSPAN